MNHQQEYHPPFRLAEWTVQPGLNRISGPSGEVQVEPRVMQVLLQLADRPEEVCPRLALLEEVWGDAIVGEENLTRAISELRRIFGDQARQPRFIETIRNHGYRLIVEVTPLPDGSPDDSLSDAPTSLEPDPVESPVPQVVPESEPRSEPTPAPTPAPEPDAESNRAAVAAAIERRTPWRLISGVILILVVAMVLGPKWLRRDTATPNVSSESTSRGNPGRPTAEPLTTFTGREWHPALSPEGLRVAFVWAGPEGDNVDIYLKQRNSESVLRLTEDAGWAAWPAWSPDGQTVAFVQQKGDLSCVCTVPAIGGAVRILAELDSWVEGLDWSPDGSQLVFSAREPGAGDHRLQVLSLADLMIRPLSLARSDGSGDFLPRYSPDGSWIAWIGLGLSGSQGIYLAPAAGGEAQRLTSGMTGMQGLSWFVGGSGLVFAEAHTGLFNLWSLPLRFHPGGDRAPEALPVEWIPTPGDFSWNPAIARQSGELVYEQVRVDQDIWHLTILERDPWRVETAPFLRSTRWESAAAFDPSAEHVVFVSSRSGSPQIWTANRDGSDLQRLTELEFASIGNPRWSPDGQRIAANVVRAGLSAVAVVGSRGGTPEILTPEGTAEVFSSWTERGTLLVGSDRGQGWQIHELNPRDNSRTARTTEGGLTAKESPATGVLFFTRPGLSGIWRHADDDQEAVAVVNELDPRDRHNWDLVGDDIVWVLRAAGNAFLVIQDLGTGDSSILAELPDLAESGLSVAGDGQEVFYTRTRAAEGDLVLLSGFPAVREGSSQ